MTRCPKCGSFRLRRTHTKWWERPAKMLRQTRPFLCGECHWRGWLPLATVTHREVAPLPPTGRNREELDLAKVDDQLAEHPSGTAPRARV